VIGRLAAIQFIRLAWSIDAGRPVERPDVVSCRYGGPCR
jgi:glucoamylase